MQWEILDTGIGNAEENMRLDANLLEGLGTTSILHFYEWARPSATYGYFLKPQEFLQVESLKKRGVEIARRPTGGGVVFHIWDMAFSVLVPSSAPIFSTNTLENYAFVNNAVLRAAAALLDLPCELTPENLPAFDKTCGRFCMAQPTKYDVVFAGKKIAGAAQRKRRQGYLHQGTIALVMPDRALLDALLLPGTRVAEAMEAHTLPLLGSETKEESIRAAKDELRKLLIREFTGR